MTNLEEMKKILEDIFSVIDEKEPRLQELVYINRQKNGGGDHLMAMQELELAYECLHSIDSFRRMWTDLHTYKNHVDTCSKYVTMAEA